MHLYTLRPINSSEKKLQLSLTVRGWSSVHVRPMLTVHCAITDMYAKHSGEFANIYLSCATFAQKSLAVINV
jgi:hypothetical protein